MFNDTSFQKFLPKTIELLSNYQGHGNFLTKRAIKMRNLFLLTVLSIFILVYPFSTSANEVFKIGVILPSSGYFEKEAKWQKNALNLLAETINKQNGINGAKVELFFRDSAMSPDIAQRVAAELINKEKVSAIVGPLLRTTSLAVSEVAMNFMIPIISTSTSFQINDPVKPYLFQSSPSDTIRITRVIEEINKNGINTIALFGPVEDQLIRTEIEKKAKEFEINIIDTKTYSYKDSQESKIQEFMKLKISKKAIIFYEYFLDLKNERWQNISKKLGNSLYLLFPKIFELNTAPTFLKYNQLQTVTPTYLFSRFMSDSQRKVTLRFSQEYSKIYNKRLSIYEISVHDAFMILKEALGSVGSSGPEINHFINNLRNFQGATGVFNFSTSNHNGLPSDTFQVFAVNEDNGCTNKLHKCVKDCNQCADSEDDCKYD
jgi:branched-chain amino acid transport system substrate-binding protein